ncbi:CinA family protein [Caulobacter sp. 73W]|uniref:CinA family protein n=1 Tax=Caulobacter sp. 73W TaxID=3161137 RepID=A0AB39KT58_9CAUL
MAVLKEACERRLRLVTAESCTGGLLASTLTDVEGCAHAFERGFVTYSDAAKSEMLGVPLAIIDQWGAVSRQVACAMAQGALSASQGDIALAVTGFAGRGAPGDEPGLVHFALARRNRRIIHREEHFGDIGRGPVRLACLRVGLELLRSSIA